MTLFREWLLGRPSRPLRAICPTRRYAFFVFRQRALLNPVEAKASFTTMAFDTETWTSRLGLADPCAATFFVSQYEPGCSGACCVSTLCCAFCCWRPPSNDFHERAKAIGDTKAGGRAVRGGRIE